MLPKGLLQFLSILIINVNIIWAQQVILEQATPGLKFQLRHLHAALPDNSRSLFANVDPSDSLIPLESLQEQLVQTNFINVPKPRFTNGKAKRRSLAVDGWDLRTTLAPNVSDRGTLFELAKMTHNAYFEPSDKEWHDIGDNWIVSPPIHFSARTYLHDPFVHRTSLSVGSHLHPGLGVTYSYLRITPPSSLLSREPLLSLDPELVGLPGRKTS